MNTKLSQIDIENNFYITLKELVQFLIKEKCAINELERVNNILTIMQSNIFEIMDPVGSYFMYFRDDILKQNESSLFNFNYSKFIIPNTSKNTKELIENLISSMKATWIKLNELKKIEFKRFITTILLFIIEYTSTTGHKFIMPTIIN